MEFSPLWSWSELRNEKQSEKQFYAFNIFVTKKWLTKWASHPHATEAWGIV